MDTEPIIESAEIHLDYFKQGDDLNWYVKQGKISHKALRSHAEQMREVAAVLEAIATIVEKYPSNQVKLDAGTHHIGITGPTEMIKEIIEKGLAQAYPDLDDEDEDGCCECEG